MAVHGLAAVSTFRPIRATYYSNDGNCSKIGHVLAPAEAAKLVRKGTVLWSLQLVNIKKVVDHFPALYELEMNLSHGAVAMARPKVGHDLLMETLLTGKR